jgi:molybdopterin converting factor small subunit
MIEIEIRPFGRFRRLLPPEGLRLSCEAGVTVAEFKRLIFETWAEAGNLADSVLATEDRILRDDEHLLESAPLALLPPVCGG